MNALAGFVVFRQQGTHSVFTQQQEVCSKFKGGIPKDTDITSTGLIPGTQTISDELQKVQVQLATARNRFTDYDPDIVKLKKTGGSNKFLIAAAGREHLSSFEVTILCPLFY